MFIKKASDNIIPIPSNFFFINLQRIFKTHTGARSRRCCLSFSSPSSICKFGFPSNPNYWRVLIFSSCPNFYPSWKFPSKMYFDPYFSSAFAFCQAHFAYSQQHDWTTSQAWTVNSFKTQPFPFLRERQHTHWGCLIRGSYQ